MARRPNLSDAQKERIADLRERGLSAGKIGKAVSASAGAVAWYCLMLAVDPPNAKPIDKTIRTPLVMVRNGKPVRRFTPEDDAKLLALSIVKRKNPTEIARAMGRRRNSIVGRLATLARHDSRNEDAADVRR